MASETFPDRFVDVDGFHIRYREAGQGPTIVGLHGAGGLRVSRSHELLAEKYRVVLFEAPGFGQSPANERSASVQDLAYTMGAAAAALGLDRFILMGTSFGGRVALWLTIENPDRVEAVVLISPAAIAPENRPISPPGAAAWQLLYAHPERQTSPPADAAVAEKQATLLGRLRGLARDPDLEGKLPSLTMPALVLFGTEDIVIPPEMGRIYREKLPNCQLVFVYDAGHALDAERPEAFASLVCDFLERREGFIVKNQSSLLYP